MKRLFALLCALALTVSLAACGKEEAGYAVEAMSLTEAMEAVLKDVPDLPMYEIAELTEENFEFFSFLPYADGMSGVTADALINAMPHSVVLVRVPDGAEDAEKTIRDSADPRKWICAEAEKTMVRRYGDTILLVMSQAETVNAILKNFDSLNGAETPEADLFIPEREDFDDYQPEELPEDVLNDPAALPEEGAVDMPVLAPDEDMTDNMPAVEDDGTAVPIPTPEVKPETPQAAPIQPEKPSEPEKPAAVSGADLEAVMASILSGVDAPDTWNTELTSDVFEFYAFIPYAEGYRGLSADPIIGSIPFSVVLVEVPEDGDAAAAAASMQSNADPRKWICVDAESVQTASKGRLAVLVMAKQALADAVIANFNAY